MTGQDLKAKLDQAISQHPKAIINPTRAEMIQASVANKEVLVLSSGALATWTPSDCTGRSPKDTYMVKRPGSEKSIDWTHPNNNPIDADVLDALWTEGLEVLGKKSQIYILDRVIGADSSYALPCRVVAPKALSVLFADNMFRAVPADIKNSIFANSGFTILALPKDRVRTEKFEGKLRKAGNKTIDLVLIMDMDRRVGLVYGSDYCGSIKKMMFTVMNYLLPEKGLLPLHCSANVGPDGRTGLFLGLSGTGKTTLSADPSRALIGDDEHGWSDNGIANFENGCYAKLINLNPEKEPEIYNATFRKMPVLEHGAIVENAMVYPDGSCDLNDSRLTENSRVSYQLSSLKNIQPNAVGGHPRTIVFLTADAQGVLPPIAKLNSNQALFWFLMGYTSKLAGTETGVTEPSSTFSRFFGGPFMPRVPSDYLGLFKAKMEQHSASVYLLNTGWSGGPYGVGKRMDINATRKMLAAVVNGTLDQVEFVEDKRFHVMVPKSCPGVETSLLNPKNTWQDKDAFERQADKLAKEFSSAFDKSFGSSNIAPEVRSQCPGK